MYHPDKKPLITCLILAVMRGFFLCFDLGFSFFLCLDFGFSLLLCLFLLFEIMVGFKLSHFEIYLRELAILRLERNRVIQSFYLHRCHTLRNHVDFFRGCPGKVNDSSPSERTTVDHFNDYTLVISQIRNLQHCAEGIITVCTRQTVMVDSLSTCRPGTRGTLRVIGCLATLMLLAAAWDA